MPLYARYGGPYVWLIDLGQQTLEVYRLDDGAWVESGVFSSTDQMVALPFEGHEHRSGALLVPWTSRRMSDRPVG